MSVRSWLYNLLINDNNLSPRFGNRVFQGGSLTSAQTIKPFLVYRFGNDTDEGLGEDPFNDSQPHRTFFQIYIHDEPGDYDQIDSVIGDIKNALAVALIPPESRIIAIRYLETSRDLDDPLLGSIFRYSRYQLVIT